MRYSLKLFLGFLIFIAFTEASLAETTISKEGQYIFNSLAFYIGGVLVALWLQDFVC